MLKPEKTKLTHQEFFYLGYKLSQKGLKNKMAVLNNKKVVKSFIGLFSLIPPPLPPQEIHKIPLEHRKTPRRATIKMFDLNA
jgi:hypothetical protein